MASSALAYFDRLRISMPFPTGVLKDLYGNVDMCVATTSIVPVNMTVYGTNATIQGLSSNFPYMFVSCGAAARGHSSSSSSIRRAVRCITRR